MARFLYNISQELPLKRHTAFCRLNAPSKAPRGGKLLSVWLFGADSEHNVHILNQYVHWFAKMPQIRGWTSMAN